MGLFLAREILGIYGISIRECGTPGTGARFEIRVPKGAWRAGVEMGGVEKEGSGLFSFKPDDQ